VTRRAFITLLGAAATWPLAARAQQPIGRTGKMPRAGMLMPGPAAHSAATLDPFYRGLHELGYIEGQNLAIEQRNGDWKRAGSRSDRLGSATRTSSTRCVTPNLRQIDLRTSGDHRRSLRLPSKLCWGIFGHGKTT
jgi:putative ABC transport system substrate-binding protein